MHQVIQMINAYRYTVLLAFVFYLALVAALYYFFERTSWITFNAYWALSLLLWIFNLVILYFVGNYMLRGILFPYANVYIKRQLEEGVNQKFSLEVTRLMLIMNKIIRIMSGLDNLESYLEAKEDIDNSVEMI